MASNELTTGSQVVGLLSGPPSPRLWRTSLEAESAPWRAFACAWSRFSGIRRRPTYANDWGQTTVRNSGLPGTEVGPQVHTYSSGVPDSNSSANSSQISGVSSQKEIGTSGSTSRIRSMKKR